jgi:hypothetical protein
MTLRTLSAIAFAAGLLAASNAYAQQQAPTGAPDLNVVPDKMPFATPYGPPITMERAQPYLLTLDDVIASGGGIPLIEGGKLIGAVGCSGGTDSQDQTVCTAAADTINK